MGSYNSVNHCYCLLLDPYDDFDRGYFIATKMTFVDYILLILKKSACTFLYSQRYGQLSLFLVN